MNYIDLFAGAGGLSEGFINAGFTPIAHVEMDKYACNTIKTRIAYHHLIEKEPDTYYKYIKGEIPRSELYAKVPKEDLDAVINQKIDETTIEDIFNKINNLKGDREIDVIVGGPPCQAYSVVGRSRDAKRMKDDERNFLFRYYADFLAKYQPKYFVFENVTGLLTAENYFEEMTDLFQKPEIGYQVEHEILNAANFGVIQSRKRVIIIGRRGNKPFKFPELNIIENGWTIKKDLFYDLPELKPGQESNFTTYRGLATNYLKDFNIRNEADFVTQHITRPHNERDLKIYRIAIKKWLDEEKRLLYTELPEELKTHKNRKSFLDRFKVVDPFGLSHTVVAHISKDGHYYIYPDLNQVRSISVREAARIQSFPDDYYFEGGRNFAFRQIGNAVPPLMAKSIAESLKSLLNKWQET